MPPANRDTAWPPIRLLLAANNAHGEIDVRSFFELARWGRPRNNASGDVCGSTARWALAVAFAQVVVNVGCSDRCVPECDRELVERHRRRMGFALDSEGASPGLIRRRESDGEGYL